MSPAPNLRAFANFHNKVERRCTLWAGLSQEETILYVTFNGLKGLITSATENIRENSYSIAPRARQTPDHNTRGSARSKKKSRRPSLRAARANPEEGARAGAPVHFPGVDGHTPQNQRRRDPGGHARRRLDPGGHARVPHQNQRPRTTNKTVLAMGRSWPRPESGE